MHFDFATVLVFLISAVGFSVTQLLIGSLLRPKFPNLEKSMIYDCGEVPVGGAWFNFNPRFYLVALVFVIFEVEIALTIPVALVFKHWVYQGLGWIAFWEIVAFVAILLTGLIWIWARKDFDWVKRLEEA